MTDVDHNLRELPPAAAGATKVKYYVVEDITLNTTPPVSGVLDDMVANHATPEWVRKLFQTGKID